jgi:hypothetical protein
MSRRAKAGIRVGDKHGNYGTVDAVRSHIVYVTWDDGLKSQHPASQLHKAKRLADIREGTPLSIATTVFGLAALVALLFLR